MKSEISAGIIVYKEKNGRVEYLLLKGKGHTNFNFPKGTKEKGESDEKTARRDLAGKAFDQLFGSAGSGIGAFIVLVLIVVIIAGVLYYKKKKK